MNSKSFKPVWWLRNSHLQTIWPVIFSRKIKNLALVRETFILDDGDFIDLDWISPKVNGPIVIILHGLEGSIKSHYAKALLFCIKQQGWNGIFMHFRGCSGRPNRLARSYHSGDTTDISEIVNKLQKEFPKQPMAAIGVSLGGNVLLKWLGEVRNNSPFNAAVAISVPFDLKNTVDRLNFGFSKIYQWHLLRNLRKKMASKLKSVNIMDLSLSKLKKIRTIRDFDEDITAPLHGFSSANQYYEKSSSKAYLQYIQTPTLILHSKDDPFMTSNDIPHEKEFTTYVKLEVTDHGGHVGFICGFKPWDWHYWFEERIPIFLKNYLNI